jgi:hypothetical protein
MQKLTSSWLGLYMSKDCSCSLLLVSLWNEFCEEHNLFALRALNLTFMNVLSHSLSYAMREVWSDTIYIFLGTISIDMSEHVGHSKLSWWVTIIFSALKWNSFPSPTNWNAESSKFWHNLMGDSEFLPICAPQWEGHLKDTVRIP